MKQYINNWRLFEGRLLTPESIAKFPDSLEKDHIEQVVEMLKAENFNPENFRVGELPIEGVYYFERAIEKLGVDYFSISLNENSKLQPQYSTIEFDENGFNCHFCNTIRESIDLHEC